MKIQFFQYIETARKKRIYDFRFSDHKTITRGHGVYTGYHSLLSSSYAQKAPSGFPKGVTYCEYSLLVLSQNSELLTYTLYNTHNTEKFSVDKNGIFQRYLRQFFTTSRNAHTMPLPTIQYIVAMLLISATSSEFVQKRRKNSAEKFRALTENMSVCILVKFSRIFLLGGRGGIISIWPLVSNGAADFGAITIVDSSSQTAVTQKI